MHRHQESWEIAQKEDSHRIHQQLHSWIEAGFVDEWSQKTHAARSNKYCFQDIANHRKKQFR